MPADDPAILAEDVTKRFGEVQALAGLDLAVPAGTCFSLLGPNGAGKTTAVRVFATITRPDGGHVRVAGHDVVREPGAVRSRIGLAGQHAALDEDLTGRENLTIFGRLFRLGARGARRRADELLEQYGLADAGDRLVKTYSGGMRRRLDLIASLIVSPVVLFLDEPTTGLDPRSRLQIWDATRELVANGTTVLLTTQQLDEADRLAEHIAVVDGGKVVARGTPDGLKARIGNRLDVVVGLRSSLDDAARALAAFASDGADPEVDEVRRSLSVPVDAESVAIPEVVRRLDQSGIEVADVGLRRPSLDEVFLTITGREAVRA
ncbi:MAG TPA: ATP-binding cassette domain-containing protein [Pseudonocardia sp.]|nr:ATP-binding cassette domain-containing protein [Pseudonocardia sp.]